MSRDLLIDLMTLQYEIKVYTVFSVISAPDTQTIVQTVEIQIIYCTLENDIARGTAECNITFRNEI